MEQSKEMRITAINHKDGTPRTDGRYPIRVGRTCALYFGVGMPMLIYWCKDKDGQPYNGVLRTSRVEAVTKNDKKLRVETMNTNYFFEEV